MKEVGINKASLGGSGISISCLGLGTMTFGEQVDELLAHRIMDFAFEHGINFIDTAEMYPIPAQAFKFGLSERVIGNWFKRHPDKRRLAVCATKISGPFRGMPWIRGGQQDFSAQDIENSCNESLKRLQTDVIDLYQIHWPARHVPSFGQIYFDPRKDDNLSLSIHGQLEALESLVKAGKIRAIGLSNETTYGVHELIRIAEQFNIPRIVSVQNPYCLLNRSLENVLDESLYRLKVSLLAYSPLAFGLLTGKYDDGLLSNASSSKSRLFEYESMRNQRWGRAFALDTARLYNQLAYKNNLSPVRLALAFCNSKWQVSSAILGVTTLDQLRENINTINTPLNEEILAKIDEIRMYHRDPA
jgi:aryl-alcohol dehydrogenase-like predicted oxidoreductase